ncbi:MAG: histidine kinase [Bacteroidales bacterium]|jgi:sensor histidine kinase YesM|nr:histidine kinase [Bacteroidales bacterium]
MALKISERSYLLEIAKITGIVLWYLLTSVSWIVTPKENITVSQILLIRLSQALAGYIIISLCYKLFNILDKKSILSKRSFIFILFPLCCIVSFFWNILSDTIGWLFKFNDLDLFSNFFFISTFFYLIPALAFTVLYYAINHWLKFKIQSEKALIATNLANEAQLQMLRYQINPHFLFNALNTIRLKVEEDKDVARKMITELANFFRFSLSQKENVVSFENEIKAIKNYLEIQKIRFEEKLQVIYDIDEKVNEAELPFYIVLPLIENAIKYGLQTSSMPLIIKIIAKLNSHLTICVQNTGKLISIADSAESTKTGLMNIRKRLELCYPGNFSFEISEKDSWVTAEIIIKDLSNCSF